MSCYFICWAHTLYDVKKHVFAYHQTKQHCLFLMSLIIRKHFIRLWHETSNQLVHLVSYPITDDFKSVNIRWQFLFLFVYKQLGAL